MSAAGSRELVFCHSCSNEWYRSEHGLICPECQSEICEVIEQDHDPREEFYGPHDDDDMAGLHAELYDAPDPDEGDVGNFTFGPMHSTFTINGQPLPQAAPGTEENRGPPADVPTNVLNNIATLVQNVMGMPTPNWTQEPDSRDTQTSPSGFQSRTTTFTFGNGHVTYTSTTNGAPAANRAMGGTGQTQNVGQTYVNMLSPMLQHSHHRGNMTQLPLSQLPGVLGEVLGPIFNRFGGQFGDAVHSDEAFDRLMSRFMEQNQTGRAPGPAPPEEIAALPKQKVDSSMLGDNGKAECTICMDEVHIGDEVTMLYCGHWFHGDCVGAWLGSHDTCPHCRLSIEASKAKANDSPKTTGNRTEGESSRRSDRSGSRRSSTYSFNRRRSSTAASNAGSSAAAPRDGSSGNQDSPRDSIGSNNGGLLDRARNLFRGGPSS